MTLSKRYKIKKILTRFDFIFLKSQAAFHYFIFNTDTELNFGEDLSNVQLWSNDYV